MHKNTLIQNRVPQEYFLEAENGNEAYNISIKTKIDLFILDWKMPGLNGLQFTRAIRDIKKYQKTPIVMVTSEAAKYNVIKAVEAGVTNYVVKPVRGNLLWKKVFKYIRI
jgi:two-component system chemotaxis response regulator CheY